MTIKFSSMLLEVKVRPECDKLAPKQCIWICQEKQNFFLALNSHSKAWIYRDIEQWYWISLRKHAGKIVDDHFLCKNLYLCQGHEHYASVKAFLHRTEILELHLMTLIQDRAPKSLSNGSHSTTLKCSPNLSFDRCWIFQNDTPYCGVNGNIYMPILNGQRSYFTIKLNPCSCIIWGTISRSDLQNIFI